MGPKKKSGGFSSKKKTSSFSSSSKKKTSSFSSSFHNRSSIHHRTTGISHGFRHGHHRSTIATGASSKKKSSSGRKGLKTNWSNIRAVHLRQPSEEEIGRSQSSAVILIVLILIGIIGGAMLYVAILATQLKDSENVYFYGAYAVGGMAVLSGMIAICTVCGARDVSTPSKKQSAGSWIACYFQIYLVQFIAGIVGVMLVTLGRIMDSQNDDLSVVQKRLSIIIAVCSVVNSLLAMGALCIVQVKAKHFGVVIRSNGRRNGVSIINTNCDPTFAMNQPNVAMTQHVAMTQMAQANQTHLQQMQMKNNLLQEQLMLQRQLNQQTGPNQQHGEHVVSIPEEQCEDEFINQQQNGNGAGFSNQQQYVSSFPNQGQQYGSDFSSPQQYGGECSYHQPPNVPSQPPPNYTQLY